MASTMRPLPPVKTVLGVLYARLENRGLPLCFCEKPVGGGSIEQEVRYSTSGRFLAPCEPRRLPACQNRGNTTGQQPSSSLHKKVAIRHKAKGARCNPLASARTHRMEAHAPEFSPCRRAWPASLSQTFLRELHTQASTMHGKELVVRVTKR